mgnify:CR=1 FL=1
MVRAGGENENNNNNNGLSLPKLPLGSIILGVIGLSCLQDLTVEIPTLGTERGDPFGTIFDAAFLGYAVSSILTQTGVTRKDRASQGADLAGLEGGVALSVGPEPGTWMDKDWAASGARLSLPLTLRFTDEELENIQTEFERRAEDAWARQWDAKVQFAGDHPIRIFPT